MYNEQYTENNDVTEFENPLPWYENSTPFKASEPTEPTITHVFGAASQYTSSPDITLGAIDLFSQVFTPVSTENYDEKDGHFPTSESEENEVDRLTGNRLSLLARTNYGARGEPSREDKARLENIEASLERLFPSITEKDMDLIESVTASIERLDQKLAEID